jgi:hypothetical protein
MADQKPKVVIESEAVLQEIGRRVKERLKGPRRPRSLEESLEVSALSAQRGDAWRANLLSKMEKF